MKNTIWLIGVIASLASGAFRQQVSDIGFAPMILEPAYKEGKGPIVLID